ncbi:MAG: ABC transporter permease, partial [Lachnospiraceae bacterium]|nr:ABC transporter permease [Lachnospiraceae bacterium]
NGRGYIGLSASNIANGDPIGSGIVAIFFGFTDALATSLKSSSNFPTEFIEMIPYASTMLAVVLIGVLRTSHARKVAKGH